MFLLGGQGLFDEGLDGGIAVFVGLKDLDDAVGEENWLVVLELLCAQLIDGFDQAILLQQCLRFLVSFDQTLDQVEQD